MQIYARLYSYLVSGNKIALDINSESLDHIKSFEMLFLIHYEDTMINKHT